MILEEKYLNEMSDKTFNVIKQYGLKYGLRVNKTDSLFKLLGKFNNKFSNLLRYAAFYLLTDVSDNETRKMIVNNAKKELKNINKKELMSFLFQLDKISFGITSKLRHVLYSVFGIEITTYGKYLNDIDYINTSISKIEQVLKKLNNVEKQIKILNKFKKSMEKLK